MRIDASEYTVNDSVKVEIENRTDDWISFGETFLVLKHNKNGENTLLVNPNGYKAVSYKLKSGGTAKFTVQLSSYELGANEQYTLVLRVGQKWIGADFKTKSE